MVAFLAEFAAPHQWAAMYRSYGLQVVPGRTGEKRPLGTWLEFQNALVPQAQFDRWFDPKAGEHRMLLAMGLLTGACSRALEVADATEGLFLVDLDVSDGKDGMAWWAAFVEVHLNGIEPETWRARSGGGGLHIFFLAPFGWVPPTFKTPIGVDLRGQGGYVVVEPSVHPNGNSYRWIEGFEPWSIPLAMAPVELTAAVDALRLDHGGEPGTPRAERTGDPADTKNAFGRDIDGREEKLANLAWALVVDLRRGSPEKPPPEAVEAEVMLAWGRYELTTKSRLEPRPGLTNADLLGLEGRGLRELRAKVAYALERWDGKVAEAALVPKPEAESENRNTWGAGLDLGAAAASDSRSFAELHGEPPVRRWLVDGWIAQGEVNSLYGGGATGKSLLAMLLGHAMAVGLPWVGLNTLQGSSLYVSCEDDADELHRRHADIKRAFGYAVGAPFAPARFWDRVGHNNLLAVPDAKGILTAGPFLNELAGELEAQRPTLVILDTLADVYGGNEIDRVQVNGFLKTCLGGLIRQRADAGHDVTILLLGHPSVAGMADGGRGFSGSTAWENGVRSRLYLSRPENAGADERLLSRGKANYAGGDGEDVIGLVWTDGVFTAFDREQELRVRTVARTVANEVATAWANGSPYTDHRGHPRYLHRAIRNRLEMPDQPAALIVQGVRRAIDEGLIYLSKNSNKRGWRTPVE